ncbi:MAG: thioesterase II family protein [Terriglobia bacterium]
MRGLFLSRRPNPDAQLRLFCLPYAGAGASRYFRWASYFPPEIEICPVLLPGREGRINEQAFTDLNSLVEALTEALVPEMDRPFALFGHSMGALISFELTRSLRRSPNLLPIHLFASGHRAPQIPAPAARLHGLPWPEFVDRMSMLEGAPEEIIAHPEYMDLILPTLRADFELCESYVYKADTPLQCPISALGGLEDRKISRDGLSAWAEQTSSTFVLRTFPGGHLYLNDCEGQVVRSITMDLSHTLEPGI